MPVDAAAGVKSRIRRNGVVHSHCHQVGSRAEIQVRRQVVLEGRIALGPVSHQVAVDPHVAVAVDAVKPYEDLPPAKPFRQPKALPVPPNAARQKPGPAGIRAL